MNDYLHVLRNYGTVTGRARRREYWMFYLVHAVVIFLLSVLDELLGTRVGSGARTELGLIAGLYLVVTLAPYVAVSVRRLHDGGRSGWWLLVSLVPLVGPIVLLIFLIQDGEPGANTWGPSPKAAPARAAR
ncbi:DUF805 domain-containing protein [Deinococcus pimensis]|uniref:DUF805 domain-containing protein n=1 Tax=Deinococcus pimensis TaxID=309888 RepID=UPI000482BC08|nr:DUF805 domain-containing protein [Deinococcus pimensis]